MKIWISSMECAGIAEAGGVKNVSYSLCKELSLLNNDITLFIPAFGCTDFSKIENLEKNLKSVKVEICNKTEKISFWKGNCKDGNFSVIFVVHQGFTEKEAVYTYTENEQNKNPAHIKGTGHTDTLFLDVLYSKAVAEFCFNLKKEELPEIIHCQDASTALIPVFTAQNSKTNKIKTIVTIHNAGPAYHHNFKDLPEAEFYTNLRSDKLCGGLNNGKVEPFLLATNYGSHLSTVSEAYADELVDLKKADETEGLSTIFNQRKIKITGITNGFDFERYDPKDKFASELPYNFNPEKNDLTGKYKNRNYFLQDFLCNEIPDIKKYGTLSKVSESQNQQITYLVYHGRITEQKGLSVLISAIPHILQVNDNVRFIIMGQGQKNLEEQLINLTENYVGKIIFLNGYNKTAARLTTVSGDFIVLPSNFEPCGLEDFTAQVYGTIPIAHKTGGLNKIIDYKTGFLYSDNLPEVLSAKILEAIDAKNNNIDFFNSLISAGAKNVHKNYLWKNVIKNKYLKYFTEI